MYKGVAANRDADMRRPRLCCREKDQVSGPERVAFDGCAGLELFAHIPWQRQAVLRENVLGEPAAVEPVAIRPTVPIGDTSQVEGGSHNIVIADGPDRLWRRFRRGDGRRR